MKNRLLHPDQTVLPVFEQLFGKPAGPVKYRQRKLCLRREHPGAPSIGLDYGFASGEAGESDAQGFFETNDAVPIIWFDFEEVYRHLDGDRDEEARAAIMRLAADALAGMLEWIQEEFVTPDTDIHWRLDTSTRCKLALLTLYRNPGVMGNPTFEQLANRLGISKQKLNILWADFTKRFPGVKAPWEKSEPAKNACRAAHGDN